MIEIKRVSATDPENAGKVFAIRKKVFVEEEGVDPNLEYDSHDPDAHHYLMEIGGVPVGAARWRETEKGIKLERFAILPAFRNRGLGEALVKEVLQDVTSLGKTIYLHSQLKAVPLYERNGFVKKGEIFYEAGMGHYYMEYMPETR
jgi:predicted GNAT family N-acyltransferase